GDARFESPEQLKPLAQKLDDVSALVHFLVGEEQTTVIVATRRASGDDHSGEGTGAAPVPSLDVHAYAIQTSRAQLAEQVTRFTDAIARGLDTIAADGRAVYDRLLGPAREQLAKRTQLVIIPDDSLWTLPFEALRSPVGIAVVSTETVDRSLLDQGVT